VELGRVDHALGQLDRVEVLVLKWKATGLELTREEDLADDSGEALGLALDHAHEHLAVVRVEGDVIPLQRLDRTEDRRERRPQLV